MKFATEDEERQHVCMENQEVYIKDFSKPLRNEAYSRKDFETASSQRMEQEEESGRRADSSASLESESLDREREKERHRERLLAP